MERTRTEKFIVRHCCGIHPALMNASDEERTEYVFGMRGIHWRKLDKDISFESFAYEDAEPTPLQKFFLKHKEIKVSVFA